MHEYSHKTQKNLIGYFPVIWFIIKHAHRHAFIDFF